MKQVMPAASAGTPGDEARLYPDADEFRAVAMLTTPIPAVSPTTRAC